MKTKNGRIRRRIFLIPSVSCCLCGILFMIGCVHYVNPDPRSELAKLRVGMSRNQVHDLVGMPSDIKLTVRYGAMLGYMLLAIVPFSEFIGGPDITETHYYYRGLGRVYLHDSFHFASGANQKVVKVIFDPTEDGYQ